MMQVPKYFNSLELKTSDISSIEMVGDAIRIPILQQSVKETYGLDLSKTLSPDECIARGTSLYVYFIFN